MEDSRSEGLGVLQFGLGTVFIVITALAVVLSAVVGAGRLFGMSASEILLQGLRRGIYAMPLLVVWGFGLLVAMRRRRQNPYSATLAAVGLAGMILTVIVVQVFQMALIASIQSGAIAPPLITWVFGLTGAVSSLIQAGCWILILMAVFARRAPDDSAARYR